MPTPRLRHITFLVYLLPSFSRNIEFPHVIQLLILVIVSIIYVNGVGVDQDHFGTDSGLGNLLWVLVDGHFEVITLT